MSAPWYAVTDPRPETAWELYHENSKRGPHDGLAVPRPAGPAPDYSGLPALALAESIPPPVSVTPVAAGGGALTLRAFSDLMATGCGGPGEMDPASAFVAITAVESLPRALAWYDRESHRLRVLRREDAWGQLHHALAAPEVLSRSAALILLAAEFDAATAVAGERGYRDALIAIGRRLAMIDATAARLSLRIEPVGLHDREVDALFHLDGLAQSIVAAVAVGL